MSFEDTARQAGQDLRQVSSADVEAALAEFHRAAPRRRRAHAGVAACTVVAAVVIAVGGTRSLLPEDLGDAQPAPQPVVTTASPTIATGPAYGCDHPLITCHGERRYSVAMLVPMDWTIPPGFEVPYSGAHPNEGSVETYSVGGGGGVTVLQGVRAAKTQARPAAVAGVSSAQSFANWLAERPFLSSTQVRSERIGGYPAWVVDATVRPAQPAGPALCNASIACYPIMVQGSHIVGAWEGMASRYTVLDLPGAGVTVVWSWGLDGELPQMADNLTASIRFPEPR